MTSSSGCCFINVRPTSFMDKWYGETNKLVSCPPHAFMPLFLIFPAACMQVEAIFTLARKLSPAIIFIDELDSFLRSRTSMDQESAALVKAQFMTLWDGFVKDSGSHVVVIGATNRCVSCL